MSTFPDQALEVSEARFRTLFAHAQVGVVLADARSRYIDANPSACRMLGYTRDELIGLHASDIVADAEIAHVEPALGEIHAATDHRRLWRFRRKDGTQFPADVIATKMPDGTLLGMIHDVSDQQRADQYREHLVAIVESSRDAIIGKDLHGIVTSWNPGAEAIFGYSAAEMIGQPVLTLVPDDRRAEAQQILERCRRGERVEQLETIRRTKEGRLIDMSISVSPIRAADGRVVGASKIGRDISATKAREREITRLTRLYLALSQINQAIVWTSTRPALFDRVCRILVEHGGFAMAWIGWRDAETGRLLPVAESGDVTGYLTRVRATRDSTMASKVAFETGRPYVCNDVLTDPLMEPWRDESERTGFRASAAFPIDLAGAVSGTLQVYADRPNVFHDREIELLEKAAADLSFSLDNFATDDARRQAERALRAETVFSDAMIDSMPGIVYFYDVSGHFLRWNHNFEIVSGYSAAEIAGMHPRQFFAAAEQPLVEARIAEVFARGESSVEASLLAKDGSATPCFFTGRRVSFDGKECLVGVGLDISDRRRAEVRLAESERQYRELVELANSIILRWDAAGRITFLNEFGQRFFGYSASEIVGRLVTETIVPPTESGGRDLRRLMDDILTNPAAFEQSTNENVRRSGERVWVSWTNRIVLDGQGQVAEFLSVGTDITDRRRAEAEAEKRHRAETADRIKSAFLATMSHELRTPLNSIIGFTGILRQGMAGPLNDEQRKQLEMVWASARHLLALVNDVLDISKIEAGQLEVMRQVFDVRRAVDKTVALVAVQAQAKQLDVRVDCGPALGAVVNDERRFEQILLNLLSNAIKFTERGAIVVSVSVMPDCAGDDDTTVRVAVTDTGSGIRDEDLGSLFQPFRQIDSGLSRQHEGTGLGLAICRRLAQLMGGDIAVESVWGKGSTFTVTLPSRDSGRP